MVKWQKIDQRKLAELREHYLHFEPYCHLNVVDMWSYRSGPNHCLKVGDTIVYKLNDYNDDSTYVTLLGRHSTKEAVQLLCKEKGARKRVTLKCVPEQTLRSLGHWNAIVDTYEDFDNHDYIFSVDSLIYFNSPELQKKYPIYQKLVRKHPSLQIKVLNHTKTADRRRVYAVFKRWVAQTNAADWKKEYLALKRSLTLKGTNLLCLGVFDGRKLIGYTVNEAEGTGYYQAFFGKGDRLYPGIGLLLEHETAKYMHEHYGSKYMNLQPDQGLEGLRHYKTSLGPLRHLKKYIVTIDRQKALAY